jgi:hypothetical protein
MKFQTSSILFLASASYANAQCLTSFDITAEHCSFDSFATALQERLNDDPTCTGEDAYEELRGHFGSNERALTLVQEACSAAHVPFSAITDQGSVFDKEYYDGGTYYNEQRESINEYGITVNRLKNDPGDRITDIYKNLAQDNGFTWPDYLSNFKDNCELNAAMVSDVFLIQKFQIDLLHFASII